MAKLTLLQRMKMDIRQDNLPIDSLLTQQFLSEYYAVSRIPVRDATAQLLSDGWLVTHGKRGVKVPRLNAKQAEELYLMRLQLEPLALQLAFNQLTNAVLGQAEDILEATQVEGLSALELGELNWQFHCCLYQVCERPILLKTLNQLHQQGERYVGFQSEAMNYHHTSEKEHYQMLALLRQKKLDGALDVLRQHIEVAGKLLVSYFEQSD